MADWLSASVVCLYVSERRNALYLKTMKLWIENAGEERNGGKYKYKDSTYLHEKIKQVEMDKSERLEGTLKWREIFVCWCRREKRITAKDIRKTRRQNYENVHSSKWKEKLDLQER